VCVINYQTTNDVSLQGIGVRVPSYFEILH